MKHIKIFIILLIFSSVAIAQENNHKSERPSKEKMKSMKIAYITEKLELTPDEAQKFWPVYNEYEKKKEVLIKEKRMGKKHKKDGVDFTDTELEQHIEKHFTSRQKELDLDKEYHVKFKSVLPMKKIGKLYVARDQFKRELLRKIRAHKKPHDRKTPSKHQFLIKIA